MWYAGDKSHYVTYEEVISAYDIWDKVLDFEGQPGTYESGVDMREAFQAAVLQGSGPCLGPELGNCLSQPSTV